MEEKGVYQNEGVVNPLLQNLIGYVDVIYNLFLFVLVWGKIVLLTFDDTDFFLFVWLCQDLSNIL